MNTNRNEIILPHEHAKIRAVDLIESVHPSREVLQYHERQLARAGVAVVFDPIPRNCRTDFHAAHYSGLRPVEVIDWIVMHDTEGPTARAAASWLADKRATGSANCVVDDNVCYEILADNRIPWGAPGANYKGYHIEQAGFATWTNFLWSSTHRNTLRRAAYRAAVRSIKYNIPVRFVKADGLKLGVRGITTHAECTKAFGGNHTDPGSGYPMAVFLSMVKFYKKQINSNV